MSLVILDTFFEEVSQELGLDSSFFRERMEEALCRYLEEQVVHSLGLLSIEDGWILREQELDNEPVISFTHELDANTSTIRYLYSKIQLSDIPDFIKKIQSRFPNEFITPSHIDQILL
jgi:hypothetical protein